MRHPSARVTTIVVLLVVVAAPGCAHRSAPVAGTPGQLTLPPLGPGMADADLDVEIEPAPGPARTWETSAAPVTTTNVKLTQLSTLDRETTVAVNPTNPLNIVGGAICSPGNSCYYGSSDGGSTWTEGMISRGEWSSAGDPAVTFCPDGSAYYSVVVITPGGPNTRSGVLVSRSTDGGQSFPTSSIAVDRISDPLSISDKPWITCDTTASTFSGRIYMEYSDPSRITCTIPFCRGIKVKRSIDSGATWSSEVTVSDAPQTPQNQGALAVGPGGVLYVAWDWVANGGENFGNIKVDKSTNGGVNYGVDKVATSFIGISQDLLFNRLTYPAMDVDRTAGPHGGYVYIAFADGRYGDADILLTRSTDGGTTWSDPIRVNDDQFRNGADQWAQGIAVDPLGRVIVTFSDRRRFVGQEKYEVWGAISRDGGETFDTNFLIADTPSNPTAATFLGDYDSVAASSIRLYALWADLRDSAPSQPTPTVYTDAFPNTFAYDEVKNVLWLTGSYLGFDPQDSRFGVDLDYDVLGGLLSELRADHGYTRAGCVAPVLPAPPFFDSRVPPDGDGYYTLVRVHGPAGVGTYGDGSPARPNLRDPLDETIVACP